MDNAALPARVGRRVQDRRQARKISQQALAVDAGLSVMTISRIERGLVWPTAETLLAIAEALECTPEDLLANGNKGEAA